MKAIHRTAVFVCAAAIVLAELACAGAGQRAGVAAAKSSDGSEMIAATADRIRRDAVGYLREVLVRCEAIPQYRLTFIRQERLGLLPTLGEPERIHVRFRAQPFSVKFDFPDPNGDYVESVYVHGANDNKLIVRERRGWMGLPPTIRRVNPADSVIWGRSKRPITEFGLANMMARTLATIENPPKGQPAVISYLGVEVLPQTGATAHHVIIMRATTAQTPCNRQDLWIDAQTGLPAGTCLVLPNGAIDALYLYADVRPDASLSDEDFRLSVPDAPTPAPAK